MTDRDEAFEHERAQAIEDLQRDTVQSFYVGTLLDEDGTQAIEYYGMMLMVLWERSDTNKERSKNTKKTVGF
jgi:hypothetical protein